MMLRGKRVNFDHLKSFRPIRTPCLANTFLEMLQKRMVLVDVALKLNRIHTLAFSLLAIGV
jgi:hypothetical protein